MVFKVIASFKAIHCRELYKYFKPANKFYKNRSHTSVGFTPKKRTLKIILDSNALFVPLEFKIDIFVEVEHLLNRNVDFVLLSPVKHELELISH